MADPIRAGLDILASSGEESLSRVRTGAVVAGLLTVWPTAGLAGSLALQVAPRHSPNPVGPCPRLLSLIETRQREREGSYGLDGRAPLGVIATGWHLERRDVFSATWVGQLRPAYQHCHASAGIVSVDNEPYRGHSYLRLHFGDSRVRLILDMSGLRDPNDYTPAILSAGMSQGLPVWSWGGSD